MKQLSKLQSILFLLGAVLMVIGAGCFVFGLIRQVMSIVFTIGVLLFVAMQVEQRYDGSNVTIRRLRKIMLTGDFFFLLSAFLMLEYTWRFLFQFFTNSESSYNFYCQYINNNFVIPLLVAAILELYSTHRIANELKKEQSRQ